MGLEGLSAEGGKKLGLCEIEPSLNKRILDFFPWGFLLSDGRYPLLFQDFSGFPFKVG